MLFLNHDFEQISDRGLGHLRGDALFFPLLNSLIGGLLGQEVGHDGVDLGKHLLTGRALLVSVLRVLIGLMFFLSKLFFVGLNEQGSLSHDFTRGRVGQGGSREGVGHVAAHKDVLVGVGRGFGRLWQHAGSLGFENHV